MSAQGRGKWRGGQTRGETLLQLLRLLGVVEDKGVQVAVAADLELDGARTFGWLL